MRSFQKVNQLLGAIEPTYGKPMWVICYFLFALACIYYTYTYLSQFVFLVNSVLSNLITLMISLILNNYVNLHLVSRGLLTAHLSEAGANFLCPESFLAVQ